MREAPHFHVVFRLNLPLIKQNDSASLIAKQILRWLILLDANVAQLRGFDLKREKVTAELPDGRPLKTHRPAMQVAIDGNLRRNKLLLLEEIRQASA